MRTDSLDSNFILVLLILLTLSLSSFAWDKSFRVAGELVGIKDSYGIFLRWQSLSQTQKSLPLARDSLVKGTLLIWKSCPLKMFWIDRNIFIQRLLSPLNYSLWGVFAKMQNLDGKKLNEGNHAEILRIKNREILAAPEMVISGTGQMCTGVKSLCFLYLELIHIFCGQIENKLPLENHHHSP